MENKQSSCQNFQSKCGKINIYVENDVSIGTLHDFYLLQKGYCVDMLVAAQNQEIENKKQWDSERESQATECQSQCI